MRNLNSLLIAIIIAISFTTQSFGQLINGLTGPGNHFSQTNPAAGVDVESVGIGDFIGAGLDPDAALHVNTNLFALPNAVSYNPVSFGEVFRTDAPNGLATFWRMLRGGAIYGNIYNRADVHFYFEAPKGDIRLNALGTAAVPTLVERMRISSGLGGNGTGGWDGTNNGTEVTIHRAAGAAAMNFPQANLNIGSDVPGNASGGRRPWMEVGTYYSFDTDNMYTGLLDMGSNRKDAIVNFGDDPNDNDENSVQNLRFIFTEYPHQSGNTDPYDGRRTQGLEIARMSAEGNMGVGALFTTTSQPTRRLEIVDDGSNHHNHTGGPQLRITNIQATSANPTTTGIWTELQTTAAGNLVITPTNAGVPQNVGINESNPQATLEINTTDSPTTGTPGPGGTGNSGLRLADLTTASAFLSTNPWPAGSHAVLSVDAQGDVVLVKGGEGTVTSSCGNSNYIPKMTSTTNVGCSQMYDDGTTVGINTGTSVINSSTDGHAITNSYRAHLKGNLVFESASGQPGDIYMNRGFTNYERVFGMYGGNQQVLAIGYKTGGTHASAASSVYIGHNTGYNTGNDYNNTFVGFEAGRDLTGNGDNENTFLGSHAARTMTSGNNNTFVGNYSAITVTSGDENTFLGSYSGDGMDPSTGNTLIGYYASNSTATGNYNTFVGHHAETTGGATTGSYNVLLGASAKVEGSRVNAVAIGTNSRVKCSNCVTIAAQDPAYITTLVEQQVGIGFDNPATTIGTSSTNGQEAKLYVTDYNGSGVSAYFDGDCYTVSGLITTSDIMFKENIQTIQNASTILDQLSPKSFTFKTNDFPSMNLPSVNQFGFIAQDVEAILPELVKTITAPAKLDSQGNIVVDKFDFKTVNYIQFIPILFSAIKQQQAELDALTAIVNNCCAAPIINPEGENRSSIQLENKASIILNQNAPNPFKEKTEISYSIPEHVGTASLIFYDQSGRILNTFEIHHKGDGTLTVYGENLAAGIYTYTLLIDGEVYKTKKMVKE